MATLANLPASAHPTRFPFLRRSLDDDSAWIPMAFVQRSLHIPLRTARVHGTSYTTRSLIPTSNRPPWSLCVSKGKDAEILLPHFPSLRPTNTSSSFSDRSEGDGGGCSSRFHVKAGRGETHFPFLPAKTRRGFRDVRHVISGPPPLPRTEAVEA